MNGKDIRVTSIIIFFVITIVSLIVGAVDINSVKVYGYSSVFLCSILIFVIQWIAWIPASIMKTERFYDITGGITYLAVIFFSLWIGSLNNQINNRQIIISILVVIWSLRLTSFLYLRIHRTGKDGRFDEFKVSPIRFLVPWTLQGLWVFLTLNVVIVVNSQSGTEIPLGIWDLTGIILWITGFSIEVIADNQKSKFNNKRTDEWIDHGLWSYCRHPNYFGEILLWLGIACFGLSCLNGLELVALISPIFVYLLLTKVSGIPILDTRGLTKWGDNSKYIEYRNNTPALIPKIKKN
ncbi:DUF1295 domain-containing protein [Euryarchaeota archaeon]|nr:DUF1295 domain-containing protein [Euryarchaeota archaeon]|tara:strand:- start:1972 stop:2856 length:885 start_codon:yes stop_codon:yes gene_type:complete